MPMASLPQGGEDEVFAPPPSTLDPLKGQGRVFAAVALGGVLGALTRYGIGLLLPHRPGMLPLGTLLINVLGGLLIGALIVTVAERGRGHPLARPFLGTGVLGGFTTFSTYTVDAQQLVAAGRAAVAVAYLAGTLVAALVATWVGLTVTRKVLQ
jgi:CrcB protein